MIQDMMPYRSDFTSKDAKYYHWVVYGPNAYIACHDKTKACELASLLNGAYQLGVAECLVGNIKQPVYEVDK